MSLLQYIQDAAIDSNQPLVASLRGAVALAERLDNSLLREWTKNELNGYSDAKSLPPYRVIRRPSFFVGAYMYGIVPAREMDRVPRQLSEKDRRKARRVGWFYALDSVAAYEDTLGRNPLEYLSFDMSEISQAYLKQFYRGGFVIPVHWMKWAVPRPEIVKLLEGVRQRLLQLAMQIEQEAPKAGNGPSALSISSQRLAQIANTIIYAEAANMDDHSIRVQGAAGNIAGGQSNVTRQGDALVSHQSGTLASLIDQLRTALEQLPPENAAATEGLVKALSNEVTSEQPSRTRMRDLLTGIAAMASPFGAAGAAVIDAIQAIQRAIGG
jgi:hypothetical protein